MSAIRSFITAAVLFAVLVAVLLVCIVRGTRFDDDEDTPLWV